MENAIIISLINKINADEFKEEAIAYRAVERFSFEKFLDEGASLEDTANYGDAHNEFFKEVGEVLSSISVLAGTIKAYFEIRKLIKENKMDALEQVEGKWADNLVESGLIKEKAEQIAKKYIADLNEALK